MTAKDKMFRKSLVKLLVSYEPELNNPKEIASTMLGDLKNIIDNSDCFTCSEESENESEKEDKVQSTKMKYSYPDWTCEICVKTMSYRNKCNHLRSKLHKQNELRIAKS